MLDEVGDVVVGVVAAVGADQPVADAVGRRQPRQVGLAAEDRGGLSRRPCVVFRDAGGRAYRSARAGCGAGDAARRLRRGDRRPTASLPLARLLGHAADAVAGGARRRSLNDALGALPGRRRGRARRRSPSTCCAGSARPQALRAPAGAEGAAAGRRRAAAARAGAAAGRRGDAAVCRAHAGRPGGGGGAPARAGSAPASSTPCCAASCASASAGRGGARATRSARYNHPAWWIERLRADWPDALAGDRSPPTTLRPPMTLRVNARRGDAAALRRSGCAAHGHRGRGGRRRTPCVLDAAAAGRRAARASPTAMSRCRTPRPARRAAAARRRPAARRARARRLRRARRQDGAPARARRPRPARARPRRRRAWRASTRRWPASACAPRPLAADAARPGALVGRPAVRRDPARRAVQRLGHRAPPSRRALAAPRRATSPRWPRPRRACSTRCGRCWRRAAGCCTAPARSSRPRASEQIDAFLQRQPATPAWPASRRRPATCCRCPTIDAAPPAPAFGARRRRLLLRPDRERPRVRRLHALRRRRSGTLSPPRPAARAGAGGVLRAAALVCWRGCAALAGAAAPPGPPSGRADRVRPEPRRGRRLPRATRSTSSSSRSVEDALQQGRAALLRRRGRGLPRPLVLARPRVAARGAGLAHRLPAADLDLARHLRRPEPDLRHPRRGAAPRSAAASRWKIAEPAQIDDGSRHYVEFSYRLDTIAAAAADADRHRRPARLAARASSARCGSTDGPSTPTAGATPTVRGTAAAGLTKANRWAWIISTVAATGAGAGARVPAVDRDQQPALLRAPLRLAVLGQRRGRGAAGAGDRASPRCACCCACRAASSAAGCCSSWRRSSRWSASCRAC